MRPRRRSSRRGDWKIKAKLLKKTLLSQRELDPSVFKRPDAFRQPVGQQTLIPSRLTESLSQPVTACIPHQAYADQMQLENGSNDTLQYPPATTSVVEIVNVENDIDINTEPRTLEERLEREINKKNDELTDVVECSNIEQIVKINTHTEGRPTDTKRRKTTKRIRVREKIYFAKKKNLRTNVQVQTQERFAKFAESNAKSLQLFAEAAMKQADAAMIAMENERQRNVLDEQRLTLEKKKLQVDENLLQSLNSVHRIMEKILDNYK